MAYDQSQSSRPRFAREAEGANAAERSTVRPAMVTQVYTSSSLLGTQAQYCEVRKRNEQLGGKTKEVSVNLNK